MNNQNNFNEAFDLAASVQYAEGSVVSRTIAKKDTGSITLFTFDKGQGLSEHSAPFDAMVNVIDGEAEVIIGGKSHFLKSGQSIVMPANIPHALKATEKFKMLLVMIK
ncbi:MAG TPA: cupin domain-containing protein [Bacteroidales bacterium]|nr:cupin domain-containing protein [Bacteroidales bacterium]